MWWMLVSLILILIYFFIYALVKAAGDADRRAEEMFYREREWIEPDQSEWVGDVASKSHASRVKSKNS